MSKKEQLDFFIGGLIVVLTPFIFYKLLIFLLC